ncbi:hypothetical protein VUR80DRAFT_405 [Thermomyces stellatus]
MYYSRLIRLLFVALSFALVAKAIQPDVGRPAPTKTVAKRQLLGPSDDDDETTTTTESKPTSTDDNNDEETTTKEESTTSKGDDETTTTDKSTPTSTSDTTKTDDNKTDKTDEPTSTKNDDNDNGDDTKTRQTSTRTTVITTTNSNGEPTSFTTEDSIVQTPGLSGDEDGGGSEGMSTETRNIVIGVVVGVGGAIVIGALAFVVFRIRNRKRAAEPDHFATMEPMDKPDPGHATSGSVGGPRNPFQSTLETYHAPTQVNASSNF